MNIQRAYDPHRDPRELHGLERPACSNTPVPRGSHHISSLWSPVVATVATRRKSQHLTHEHARPRGGAAPDAEQRMVFGANTYRLFVRLLGSSTEDSEVRDPWVTRMRSMPATVVSTTLEGPLDWPGGTVVRGDAVDVVARLKEEFEVPLRSHGSLSMNRALMAAALVDRVQVTLFPVITGQTGADPIFQGAPDFDLELTESRTLDGNIQELIYRPTLHV